MGQQTNQPGGIASQYSQAFGVVTPQTKLARPRQILQSAVRFVSDGISLILINSVCAAVQSMMMMGLYSFHMSGEQ
eukprot:659889-Rhodomonas_salina.2